jgi:hypothetical protein
LKRLRGVGEAIRMLLMRAGFQAETQTGMALSALGNRKEYALRGIFVAAGILFLILTVPFISIAEDTIILPNATVYVVPNGGNERLVMAALVEKKTPVTIVADRNSADFEIRLVHTFDPKLTWTRLSTDITAFVVVKLDGTPYFVDLINLNGGIAHSADHKDAAIGTFAEDLKNKIEKQDGSPIQNPRNLRQ